jgi:hypothetical protein
MSRACSKCDSSFSLFVRRHHCRECGMSVCHSCSCMLRIDASSNTQDIRFRRTCNTCKANIKRDIRHKSGHAMDEQSERQQARRIGQGICRRPKARSITREREARAFPPTSSSPSDSSSPSVSDTENDEEQFAPQLRGIDLSPAKTQKPAAALANGKPELSPSTRQNQSILDTGQTNEGFRVPV